MMYLINNGNQNELTNTEDRYCRNEKRLTRHYPFGEGYKCLSCGSNGQDSSLIATNNQATKKGECDMFNYILPDKTEDDKDFVTAITAVIHQAEIIYDMIIDGDLELKNDSLTNMDKVESFEKAIENLDDDHRKILGIFVPLKEINLEQFLEHHAEEAAVGNI